MKALFARLSLAGALGAMLAGCTVHETQAPGLTGPSEFALSFGLTATPDTISHDGISESVVVLRAFDASGQPQSSLAFRLETLWNGVPADYGKLSARTVVTNGDGRATVVFTSPPKPPNGAALSTCHGLAGGCVQITATPIGSDFAAASSRTVDIHLIPVAIIQPTNGLLVARFTFSPADPEELEEIDFSGEASTPGPNNRIVSYQWNWGDGDTGSGPTEQHDYVEAGKYTVTLTVIDDAGNQASTTKTVTVTKASS